MSIGKDEWATWTCATCQVEMDDPVTTKATTCSNGHTNYLGTVHAPGGSLYVRGNSRRAFKTKAALRRARAEEKHVTDTVQEIFKSWQRINPERVAK